MEHTSSTIFSGACDPRETAAAALVGTLRRCEHLAGELIAEQGRLAAAAIDAEQRFGLSAVAGQMVLTSLAEAQRRTADARGALVTTHRNLERLGSRMGLDLSMYGDTGKPPEPSPTNPFTTAIEASPVVG